jgi:hypothetical protein
VSNLLQGVSRTISIGPGQPNQITAMANSDTISLYANEHYLASVMDSALSAGKIGLGVVNRSTPVEVRFTNAQVWVRQAAGGMQTKSAAGASPTATPSG